MLYFWIAFFIISCIGAKISILSHDNGGGKWFWISCLLSAIPWFAVMTVWTKSLLIDSVVYDAIILFSYLLIYIICGEGKFLTTIQWVGLSLTVIGLILMKLRG